MKQKLILGLKTIISIGLLILVLTWVDLKKVWYDLQSLSFSFISFALLYYTFCQILSCLRWQQVLKASDYHIGIPTLLSSYFAGMFLNIFLPGSFGGDIYRVYRVSQKINDSEVAIVSVFLERFTGLVALAILALAGLIPAFSIIGRWDIIILFFACVGSLVGGVLLLVNQSILTWFCLKLSYFKLDSLSQKLLKMQQLVINFIQHRTALLHSMTLSLLLMLAIVYYHYFIAQALHISISYWQLLVFIPIISVITLLPISLGGLGIKESLWIYLFNRIALSSNQALLLSITITALGWLLSLPGGLILLWDYSNKNKHNL